MLKNNRRALLLSSAIILLPVLIGLLLWNRLPQEVPTHFGPDGQADGWSSKPFAVFGLPAFLLAVHWVCLFFTAKDPKNETQHHKVAGLVLWICPVVSLFVAFVSYAAALGLDVNVSLIAMLLVGVMFVAVGNYMPKCKQNHTIGIKIPWTLNDEGNWNATHRFAGKVWVIGGLLFIVCAFLPPPVFVWAFLPLIFALVLIPTLYSYNYHKKHG